MRLLAMIVVLFLLADPAHAQTSWPASSGDGGILGWVFAALGAGGVGGLLKMAFAPAAPTGTPAPAVDHEAIKQTVHDTILQLVQSGALSAPVQVGLGAIPGAGAFASQLEPLIRKVALDVLQKDQGADMQAMASEFGGIARKIQADLADLRKRLGQPSPPQT